MKARYILASIILTALPAMASAQTTNSPKYPPGFDCDALPAGSERESCNQSQMKPSTGNNGIIDPADPGNAGGAIQTPSDISPPTVPNNPGSNSSGNGGGVNDPTNQTP